MNDQLIYAELCRLALVGADGWYRGTAEGECALVERDGLIWSDTSQPDSADELRDGLRYLELRGADLPYSVVRDGALIRFGEKGK